MSNKGKRKELQVAALENGTAIDHIPPAQLAERSEERRVGKECRSRWSPYP